MKFSILKIALVINTLISMMFLIWYFFFNGYLGYGYADLFVLFTFLGSIILLFVKIERDYNIGIYIFLIIYNFWFFNLMISSY